MKITGLKQVNDMLERKKLAMPEKATVLVGFTAKYALFVHENLNPKTLGQNVPRPSGLGVFWGPAMFGPKFLEAPARMFAKDIVNIVTTAYGKGLPLIQALLLGGLRLQREAMMRVPVEYGNLRASAFTREDDGE